jgi:UDP-2,3-diacylglucosamine hydrolase
VIKKEKIYFVSDLHLGVPSYDSSLAREKLFVQWLDDIKKDATSLYLMGDVFDFWFEYKHSIPKYFTRLFGKLAELSDQGIPIFYFTGNHDMWVFNYFEEELKIKVHHQPIELTAGGKTFFIGHGDGLGPRDRAYKILKYFFRSRLCQFLFEWIHPNIGIGIANFWSRKSRLGNAGKDAKHYGEEEWLLIYSKEKLKEKAYDYFIFGHRHLPMDVPINEKSRYINLGDWLVYFSYAEFDGENLTLKYYHKNQLTS